MRQLPGKLRDLGAGKHALASLFVVAAAGLSLARQPGAGALDTVYAEDGTIFLSGAYQQSTIFSPYAGYLHVVPRLLAELVSLLPRSAAAAALAMSAALVTGLLALLVFVASGSVLPSLPARLLVSGVVVLVPVGQDEILNSIANLHWPMLYALFWLLLWRPVSRAGRIVGVSSVLLIVLSDVMSMVFAPLALWRWWARRDTAPAVAMGLGLAAQAAAIAFGPGGRAFTPEPVMWAPWWVIRAVPSGVLGQRWLGSDVDRRWLMLAAVAWLIVAVFVLVGLRGRYRTLLTVRALATRPPRTGGGIGVSELGNTGDALATQAMHGSAAPLPAGAPALPRAAAYAPMAPIALAVLAAVHCVAVYALPVALSGQATPRYAVAPAMLLVTALVALTFERKTAFGALAALLVVVWTVNFRVPNERADGPLWSDELPRACANGEPVPITPPGWEVTVPCRD